MVSPQPSLLGPSQGRRAEAGSFAKAPLLSPDCPPVPLTSFLEESLLCDPPAQSTSRQMSPALSLHPPQPIPSSLQGLDTEA